jgi:hypothetical protein
MTMSVNHLSYRLRTSTDRIFGAGLGLVLAFFAASPAGCGSKGSTSGAGGSAGAGATSGCAMGSEGCACYGNDTCNAPLTCLSHLCVNAGGGAGASGSAGAPGTGGTLATGGSTGTGGSASTGSGGASATGGTPGTGGTPATGGTPGTGGTPATGGTTGTGGTPATGGTPGTGGTPATGGTTGGGGAAPSGPLQFTGGWVDATTNSYGIQGSIYTFDDGVGSTISPDCGTGATCFGGTTTPTTRFCVNGTDTTVGYESDGVTLDYSTYWGAAVGFDLNDPAGGTKTTYPAASHHVVGFSMNLTNSTYPSDKVQFTYSVYNGSTNVQYCLQQLYAGANTVYFTNTQTLCWTTGGTLFPTNDVNGVVSMQWGVPSSPDGPVPFNFCIDSLTPIIQ